MTIATLISELDIVALTEEHPEVTFGRSPEVDLQIGHRPILDRGVAKHAGRVWWAAGELLVQNHHRHVAIGVQPEGRRTVELGPGQVFGPATDRFDLYVPGELGAVELGAVVRHVILVTRDEHDTEAEKPRRVYAGPATNPPRPRLSDRQVAILDTIAQPMREGLPEPRSYKETATLVNWSEQLVRAEMTNIWQEFDNSGVPMLSHSQKSRAVIEAWLDHQVPRR
jgi:hypothetical protein